MFSQPKNQTQFKANLNPIKACPERIEFTLSVIEGNGPILEGMNVNCCAAGYYRRIVLVPLNEHIDIICQRISFGNGVIIFNL
jgi:hypothetical protein